MLAVSSSKYQKEKYTEQPEIGTKQNKRRERNELKTAHCVEGQNNKRNQFIHFLYSAIIIIIIIITPDVPSLVSQ